MTSSEKRNAVLALARKQIGIKEYPANSNKVKFNDWFYGVVGHDGAWCGTSLSWIFSFASCPIGTIDYLKGIAGVPFALKALKDPNSKKNWGTIISKEEVRPGDIFIVDWLGDGIPDHIGIVEKTLSLAVGGDFGTLEGNTSAAGSQSNGGEYMEKIRHYNSGKAVWTFVRPRVYDIV